MSLTRVLASFVGLAFAATAFAQTPETVVPMQTDDVRVVYQNAIDLVKAKIESSKNLSTEERIRIAEELERDTEALRDELDNSVLVDVAQLGGKVMVAGLVLTYAGEKNFASAIPRVGYSPGAELGVTVFVRRNSYIADAFVGKFTALGSFGVEGAVGTQQTAVEKGWSLKVLLINDTEGASAVRVDSFVGLWQGINAEFVGLSRSFSGRVYTQLQTCKGLNVFTDCGAYLISLRAPRRNMAVDANASVGVKGLYLTFPQPSEKSGWKFF